MYRNCPEHPDIASALRTGYPRRYWEDDCYDDDGICGEEEEDDCADE